MAKVLVVDDSLSVRKVVERALVARQLEVVSAASGNEAIAQIERELPDLVVCDVVMPDRDGYEICRFVKSHPKLGRVPVLLISGIVNGTVLEQAAEARSDDVLRKPFEAAELVRKVSELLAGNGASGRPATARLDAPAANGAPVPAAQPAPATVPVPPAAPPITPQSVAAILSRARSGEPSTPPAGWTPPAPAPRVEPAAAARPPAPLAPDLRTALAQFMTASGADWAALSDREGFLIEAAGAAWSEVEIASAMAACLVESSEGIGRELGRGGLGAMLVEYEKGSVLLHTVGSTAVLAVMLKDAAALGKVRYYVKRFLPDLARFV
ncbi:MAG TPA: response regulator [Methylomirabilota bacterium]|nr:response regulator [Methylomirabilota bacterium]